MHTPALCHLRHRVAHHQDLEFLHHCNFSVCECEHSDQWSARKGSCLSRPLGVCIVSFWFTMYATSKNDCSVGHSAANNSIEGNKRLVLSLETCKITPFNSSQSQIAHANYNNMPDNGQHAPKSSSLQPYFNRRPANCILYDA